jgi:chorismate mutase
MNLEIIRKYLDEFDKALCVILLHRMSLIPLVADTKVKNGIEVFQQEREKQMFESIKEFCSNSEINKSMITDIYRRIIDEAYIIEDDIINNGLNEENFSSDGINNFYQMIKELNLLSKELNAISFNKLTMHYKKTIN